MKAIAAPSRKGTLNRPKAKPLSDASSDSSNKPTLNSIGSAGSIISNGSSHRAGTEDSTSGSAASSVHGRSGSIVALPQPSTSYKFPDPSEWGPLNSAKVESYQDYLDRGSPYTFYKIVVSTQGRKERGCWQWELQKRYNQFQQLHNSLDKLQLPLVSSALEGYTFPGKPLGGAHDPKVKEERLVAFHQLMDRIVTALPSGDITLPKPLMDFLQSDVSKLDGIGNLLARLDARGIGSGGGGREGLEHEEVAAAAAAQDIGHASVRMHMRQDTMGGVDDEVEGIYGDVHEDDGGGDGDVDDDDVIRTRPQATPFNLIREGVMRRFMNKSMACVWGKEGAGGWLWEPMPHRHAGSSLACAHVLVATPILLQACSVVDVRGEVIKVIATRILPVLLYPSSPIAPFLNSLLTTPAAASPASILQEEEQVNAWIELEAQRLAEAALEAAAQAAAQAAAMKGKPLRKLKGFFKKIGAKLGKKAAKQSADVVADVIEVVTETVTQAVAEVRDMQPSDRYQLLNIVLMEAVFMAAGAIMIGKASWIPLRQYFRLQVVASLGSVFLAFSDYQQRQIGAGGVADGGEESGGGSQQITLAMASAAVSDSSTLFFGLWKCFVMLSAVVVCDHVIGRAKGIVWQGASYVYVSTKTLLSSMAQQLAASIKSSNVEVEVEVEGGESTSTPRRQAQQKSRGTGLSPISSRSPSPNPNRTAAATTPARSGGSSGSSAIKGTPSTSGMNMSSSISTSPANSPARRALQAACNEKEMLEKHIMSLSQAIQHDEATSAAGGAGAYRGRSGGIGSGRVGSGVIDELDMTKFSTGSPAGSTPLVSPLGGGFN